MQWRRLLRNLQVLVQSFNLNLLHTDVNQFGDCVSYATHTPFVVLLVGVIRAVYTATLSNVVTLTMITHCFQSLPPPSDPATLQMRPHATCKSWHCINH